MSYLAEVLSNAEMIEINEINKKVPELQLMIENFKSEVIQYTENIYIKYSGRPKQNKALLNKACEIGEEMKILKKNAENVTKKDLVKANIELEQHISSLTSIDFTLNIVSRLCQINEQLIQFTNLLESKDYLACMKLICQLETTIKEIPEDEYVEILNEFEVNIEMKKNMLLRDLSNVFTDHIIVQNKNNILALKIKKNSKDLQEALLALFYNTSVVYPLHSFAKSLWNFYFVPIVDTTVNIVIREDNTFNIVELTTIDSSKKSNYSVVFSNLKLILEFLKNYFDLKINEELTTLKYIGEDIRDNLSELIIKHCLQDTIPSTAEGLQKYKIVIEETEKLESILRACDIFANSTMSILEYANNIDILFINKKCHEYSTASELIMKKDLHDMTEVGVPYNPDNPLDIPVHELLHCSVSKSVIELMHFIEDIIQQAVAASDICAGRLFCTVKNIITKYGQFVPQHHSKLLQTIPQQVALFHNNCFYISHKLTQWNQVYSSKLSSKLDTGHCGFTQEIHQIELIAAEHFTNYVKGHIKQIHEIMEESGLTGPTIEVLEPKTEKCIRQCLRQQELLKTVWHKVLSYPIYNQTIGALLNSLCSSMITCIIKFEDIPSNFAEQLVEILKIVLNRGPKLFTDPKEISLYVSSWYKLNELNFVLAGSLLDINDRWADGKGPLSLQFSASELKSLIRALFQNTDRRSAVLAKIQD